MPPTRSTLAMALLLACCTACGRTPANDAPKPFNRYIASMLPLFAGAYQGHCKRGGEAPRKGAVTVSGAGLASGGPWQHDLMREQGVLSMQRILKAGKPELSVVMFEGKSPDWTFMLSSLAKPDAAPSASASLGEGEDLVMCEGIAPATGFGQRALYPAVAAHFSAASAPMSCEAVNKGKPEKTTVRIGPRGVKADEYAVAFDQNVGTERLIADAAANTLGYAVNYDNGDEFTMFIDGAGALLSASFLGQSGLWVCKRP